MNRLKNHLKKNPKHRLFIELPLREKIVFRKSIPNMWNIYCKYELKNNEEGC